MKIAFRKLRDEITCEIFDIQCNDFRLEDGFYCYEDEVADEEFKLSFRLKVAEEEFLKGEKISSVKKHTYFRKRKNGFCILFRVSRGKYAENRDSNRRFYFYQENSEKIRYSFKFSELKEKAFDYEVIETKISDTHETKEIVVNKKKKLTVEERRIKKQKWLLEHPYQGGAFSPR